MKRIILLMSLVFIFAVTDTALAEKRADVIIGSKEAKRGDIVEVGVDLKNNDGLLALMFELTYDESRLSLVEAKAGNIVEGPVFSRGVDVYPYIMLWNSASYDDFTNDGTLVTLTFKVADDAESGQAFIQLDYKQDNVYDVDFNEVKLEITNGYINVVDNNNSSNTGASHKRSGSDTVRSSPMPTEAATEVLSGTEEDNSIILWINKTESLVFGEMKYNDVAPIIRNDRTMLPARFVAENLGANVEWFEEERKVSITAADREILLFIDSDIAYINGGQHILDSPAFIENERTYTPVRFVAESLGAIVDWRENSKSVIITKK